MITIAKFLDQTPVSVKVTIDTAAVGVGLAHLLGWWNTYAGTVTTTVGLIWMLAQAYFYLKDRYTKKS